MLNTQVVPMLAQEGQAMFLDTGGGLFGDSWWIFPLVGIPMMLVMMGGMMFMMRMMMGSEGMGGMWSHGPADAAPKGHIRPSERP